MNIIEVKTKREWALFHRVPHAVYAGDPNWICPLESDVQATFNPSDNVAFEDGEASVFVLLDEHGIPVGRIAAFIDHKRNKTQPYPVGGIGFFECIDNPAYANALFEHAEKWLKERQVAVVEGPINFGERDRYWGLLDRGFYPPLFLENYQPRYYKRFFEDNGYVAFEQILTLKGFSKDIPVERMRSVAARIRQTHKVQVEAYHPSKAERYARDFCEVYNASFRHFLHFKPVNPAQIRRFLKRAQLFIDPCLLCIAYYEDKPAGFCLLFPDINPLLKSFNGRLGLVNAVRLLWKKRITKVFQTKGIGFGVHPDYKSKGIFAFVVEYMATPENQALYPEIHLPDIRAHNKEILSIYDKIAVHVDRVHLVFRKALYPDVVITPYPFFDEDKLPSTN